MKCFVTGASGFIGINLVKELLNSGNTVKALYRGPEKPKLNLDCEWINGDILDHGLLEKAMRGCDWCFHVAAVYKLWMRDYSPMYKANVDGTRNVIQAAAAAGCSRIVYTSTVGCIGLKKNRNAALAPATEETDPTPKQLSNHYKKSKWLAELVARDLATKGLPVVIVNPSAPVGPLDAKPTPTGQVIVDFLNRKIPAYVDTGLNWVHVQDVAKGHILAAKNGKIGQRYILGNLHGNLTLKQAFDILSEITSIPAPGIKIPWFIAFMAACFDEIFSKITGKAPRAPLAGVRMARYKMFFDPSKAIKELGMPQTPVKIAFSDAIKWFSENGYIDTKVGL